MIDEDIKQRLSLLVDDQIGTSEGLKLLERIQSNREAALAYSHYLLIGEAMRSPGGLVADPRLTDRIHAAIEREPSIIAPAWKNRRTRERIATAALAATLAGVAVLVGKGIIQQPSLVGSALEHLAQAGSSQSSSPNPTSSLHNYLVNHNETAYLAANGGLFPYARLISDGNPGR